MERFGVGKVLGRRACGMYSCKDIAKVFIGDKKQQHAVKNFFLCDKHANIVMEELAKIYNIDIQAFKGTLDEQNAKGGANTQSTINDFLKASYDSNGTISKAKLMEICQKNGIEMPEEIPNMKGLMELMFKDELD